MKLTKLSWLVLWCVLIVQACSKSGTDPLPPIDIPDPEPNKPDTSLVIQKVDDDIAVFMSKYNVPALSLAITRHGKLVYAKAYGYADKEKGEMATTKSLFRIASLSKWITSSAIMKLIQEGKLSMNDKVFGTGAVLGTDFGTQPYGNYITEITIGHLLHHTGGGWGNASNDPMFAQPQLNGDDLLTWILDNRPLNNPPGTNLEYSNVGFFILSHVIQKVTGLPYETYVKENILKPAGITNMQIGATTLSGRKPDEVKYYGSNPYGYADGVITRISGAGAWLATATDLMRFLVRVDGFPTVPDMLNNDMIAEMSSTTPASENYGCGLRVSASGNWYHGGTYNGTRTWMVRTTSGYCWAILTNIGATGNFNTDLDKLIWPAVNDSSTPWPATDLF
jgi:Beta-lactamase class C and other penicillin binding proteins